MRSLILATAALTLLAGGVARADEVVKKDGTSSFGYIVSETRSTIILMDHKGRRLRIRMDQVESVIESAQTGNETIDAKTAEVDISSASDLFEVAKWAKGEGELGWRLVAMFAVRTDEDHSGARELLGHVKVGDKWYDDSEEADKARIKLVAEERKAEGYIKVKGGWIKKEDRSDLSRNPEKWVIDDTETWVDKKTYMEEKGFIEVNGKFIKAGTEEDKADMTGFKDLMGDDIWIYTTQYFRLCMQEYPPEQVAEYAELIDKVYVWFKKEMEIDAGTDIFRGNRPTFWVFKSKNVALEWYQQYRNRYSLGDTFGTLLNNGGGNVLSSVISVHVRTPNEGQDIRHDLVNHTAHFLLNFHSPTVAGVGPPWVSEGFGVFVEQQFLDLGTVIHSTLADYGGSGGMADKQFTTKSAPDRAKAMVREGIDEDIVTLDKLELNSISGDHVAKAYTLIDMLWKQEKAAFIEWINLRPTNKNLDAMEKAFGRSPNVIDKEWRKHVKKG